MSKQWNALSQGSKIVAGVGCGAAIVLCCGTLALAAAMSNNNTPSTSAASTSTHTGPTATPAPPTATAKPKKWVTAQHFTGSETQQTPTFSLPDGARIVWSATASNEFGGSFSITSYGSDGSYGDLIANTSTPPRVSGTFNVHGSQDIYLKIDTFGCTYDIVVQVYQ